MYLFALVLLVTLLVAWGVSRSRPSKPVGLRLRALWLAPAAVLCQVPLWQAWGDSSLRAALFLLSYALLVALCALNWHVKPMRLLALGFSLNWLVVAANGGFMPISPETMASLNPGTRPADWPTGLLRAGSKDIVLPAAQTRLYLLSDIWVVGPPFPLPTAFSVGDLLIWLGFGMLAWRAFQGSALPGGKQSAQLVEVNDAL
jgi:hypothetical protein